MRNPETLFLDPRNAGWPVWRFFHVRATCGVLGDNPMRRLLIVLALVATLACSARAAFPPGFLWGTAISGFQTEMCGKPGHNDTSSDWWAWVHDPDNMSQHRVSSDLPEAGSAFYDKFRAHSRKARPGLRSNKLRPTIACSRIFRPVTAAVD